MAYDKVVDSTLLDAGLTATANAIRAKTGSSSPIAWDSANGFKAAVEGIDTEGGVELPELGDTAAQSSDIVYGKILYDDDGNPVTGTMTSFDSEYSPKPKNDGSGNVVMELMSTENTYLPAWNQLSFKIPFSEFGNATEDDVLADIEFTSSAGLLARGSIPKKTTSDITVNNATVTIPRGYYESAASKSVSMTTQATPSISVDTAGKITASVTQTAGYVNSGTKTATEQLSVQVAQTITPGTSDKTIASGKYLTGTQTIKGDSNLKAENIKSGVSIFGVVGSNVGVDTSGGLVYKSGKVIDNTVIETGLSSVSFFILYRTSISAQGLLHAMKDVTAQVNAATYCSSYSSYFKTYSSSTTEMITMDGGTVTFTASGSANMISGLEYMWVAFGLE